jgi:hypothetical protein
MRLLPTAYLVLLAQGEDVSFEPLAFIAGLLVIVCLEPAFTHRILRDILVSMPYDIAAIGQITISCAVAYVAWQQWKTARDKLQLDRYESKRYTCHLLTEF